MGLTRLQISDVPAYRQAGFSCYGRETLDV